MTRALDELPFHQLAQRAMANVTGCTEAFLVEEAICFKVLPGTNREATKRQIVQLVGEEAQKRKFEIGFVIYDPQYA